MNWKSKPVLIGGGVAVIAIVLIMSSGGGSSSGGTVTTGPTGEQLASQTQLALAQISAGVQTSAQNANLAALSQQGQIDLARATMDVDLARYALDAERVTRSQELNLTADIQRLGIASQDRATDAGLAIQRFTLEQAAALQVANNNFQLDYAEQARESTETLARISADLTAQQIASNAAVTSQSLQAGVIRDQINADYMRDITNSNNAAQAAMVVGMYNATTEQARIAANVDITQSNNQARTAQQGSSNNLIGGIIGGILGIFSDRRLKENIQSLGIGDDGLGIYAYSYRGGDGTVFIGNMADEVETLYPDAMGPTIGGFKSVRYAV